MLSTQNDQFSYKYVAYKICKIFLIILFRVHNVIKFIVIIISRIEFHHRHVNNSFRQKKHLVDVKQ